MCYPGVASVFHRPLLASGGRKGKKQMEMKEGREKRELKEDRKINGMKEGEISK
jgi:hypothetical protein